MYDSLLSFCFKLKLHLSRIKAFTEIERHSVRSLTDSTNTATEGAEEIGEDVKEQRAKCEVVQINKCTCTVFIDNLRNISTNSSI